MTRKSIGKVTRKSEQRMATINGIRQFLSAHMAEVPEFHELASMAGMSRSHFSRTFHAVAGMSLRHYILRQRVERACELLKQSHLSLTSIAVQCGFYDLPHLNKAFRRRFGVSPYRFRHGHDAEYIPSVAHRTDGAASA